MSTVFNIICFAKHCTSIFSDNVKNYEHTHVLKLNINLKKEEVVYVDKPI